MDCPHCAQSVPEKALVCINCGYNFQTGKWVASLRPDSSPTPKPYSPNPRLAFLGCGLVALVLGGLIFFLIQNEIHRVNKELNPTFYKVGPGPKIKLNRLQIKTFHENLTAAWKEAAKKLTDGAYQKAATQTKYIHNVMDRILVRHRQVKLDSGETWEQWLKNQDQAFANLVQQEYARRLKRLKTLADLSPARMEMLQLNCTVSQKKQWQKDRHELSLLRAPLAKNWLRVIFAGRMQRFNDIFTAALREKYHNSTHQLVFAAALGPEEARATWKTLKITEDLVMDQYEGMRRASPIGIGVITGTRISFSMQGVAEKTSWDHLADFERLLPPGEWPDENDLRDVNVENCENLRRLVRMELQRIPTFRLNMNK